MTIRILRFANLLLVALLAGTSFGIWAGLNPMGYSPATYLEQQQHLVSSLNTLMVAMVILAMLTTIAAAFLQKRDKPVFYTLLVAALFLFSCIVISRIGNLPIQQEMLGWKVDSMPKNWTVLRDKWWEFHVLRTVVELIALVLIVWTNTFGVRDRTNSV